MAGHAAGADSRLVERLQGHVRKGGHRVRLAARTRVRRLAILRRVPWLRPLRHDEFVVLPDSGALYLKPVLPRFVRVPRRLGDGCYARYVERTWSILRRRDARRIRRLIDRIPGRHEFIGVAVVVRVWRLPSRLRSLV